MKRRSFIALNIVSLVLIIISMCILKIRVGENSIFDMITAGSYIESFDFKEKTNKNINNVFSYINLQNIFENSENINEKTILANEIDDDFNIYDVTLKDINNKATDLGFYISENYEVLQYNLGKKAENEDRIIKIFNRKYINDDNEYIEIKTSDFIKEVYLLYSEYLKLHNYYANTNFNYIVRYWTDDLEKVFANTNLTLDTIKNTETHIYASTYTNVVDTVLGLDTSSLLIQLVKMNPLKTKANAYFCANVDTDFNKHDDYYRAFSDLNNDKIFCAVLIIILFLSIILFIYSLVRIFLTSLHNKKEISIVDEKIFTIPIEIVFMIGIATMYICIYIINLLFKNEILVRHNYDFLRLYINRGVIYTITFLFIMYVVYQYESGYFNTDIYEKSLIGRINNNTKVVMSKFPKRVFFATMIIPIIALVLVIIVCIYFYIVHYSTFAFILGALLIIVSILILAYILLLNNAYVNTLSEQIKSTTTSTKLITNISHDLRTPLTSIINYSDLINRELKKDDCNIETINNYAQVINDKSQKLKILLDDLILASKASSRNIDLHFEKININEFIEQVFGEFEDRFIEKNFKLVKKIPETDMFINADGNELYRVFQNLISNIINYGLENTRIHLAITENRNLICISVKNVSKNEINMTLEELTDRFSRGDNSRNSEGFGLGLSIAKDLVIAMNGKFKLNTDGDLFIVSLEFLKA